MSLLSRVDPFTCNARDAHRCVFAIEEKTVSDDAVRLLACLIACDH